MSAVDLAGWAADAFASYDVAATHRIVTATTGDGPLPDYVSARADPLTGLVELPRPVGVVLVRGVTTALEEVVRRVLLTRNVLLVEDGEPDRIRKLAALAEAAGAPAGVLQVLDTPGPVDLVLVDLVPVDLVLIDLVLEPAPDAPVVVIVDEGARVTIDEAGAVVLTVGAGCADLGHAIRVARGILRESGGDRVRVHSADPGAALRVAAALPVTRVALGDLEMPPPAPDGLLTWTRISTGAPVTDQPWASPTAPAPAYPRASNDSP